MHVTLVYVHVKPEFVAPFVEATRANHENSIREPGNRRFDILQQADDPTQFVFVESYNTAEDSAAHKKTAHYAAWRDRVADWMVEPRKGVLHNGLFPK
jgi:(4S)-4-hydroxy-5-phosphonooxypentane-2,3-dione isomerase